jgi:hypothetical protein
VEVVNGFEKPNSSVRPALRSFRATIREEELVGLSLEPLGPFAIGLKAENAAGWSDRPRRDHRPSRTCGRLWCSNRQDAGYSSRSAAHFQDFLPLRPLRPICRVVKAAQIIVHVPVHLEVVKPVPLKSKR